MRHSHWKASAAGIGFILVAIFAIIGFGLAGGPAISVAQEPGSSSGNKKGSEEFEDLDRRSQEWLDLMKDFDGHVRPDLFRKAVNDTQQMKIDAKMEKKGDVPLRRTSTRYLLSSDPVHGWSRGVHLPRNR